jgi:hypothetical protein
MTPSESDRDEPVIRTHESVDHIHPTDAGLMDPSGEQIPATGIMGDETLVRMTSEGVDPYPLAPPHPEHHTGQAHPGPTRWPNDTSNATGDGSL